MIGKLGIGLALTVAVAFVIFASIPRTARPTAEEPHLLSMEASAQSLKAAGLAMQQHGQAMLADGQQAADIELISDGEHWVSDGQMLVQRGEWLAVNPTTPGPSATPDEWVEMSRTAQMMLRDPSRARELDLEALRWNGLAMRAEGQNMAEHGRLMTEQVEVMVARHGPDDQSAADLRQAAQTMHDVGGYLGQNGQAMMDYAGRLRQSMGYR
jgi:hypothetical protein